MRLFAWWRSQRIRATRSGGERRTYPGLLRHSRRSRSSRAGEGTGGRSSAGRRRCRAGSGPGCRGLPPRRSRTPPSGRTRTAGTRAPCPPRGRSSTNGRSPRRRSRGGRGTATSRTGSRGRRGARASAPSRGRRGRGGGSGRGRAGGGRGRRPPPAPPASSWKKIGAMLAWSQARFSLAAPEVSRRLRRTSRSIRCSASGRMRVLPAIRPIGRRGGRSSPCGSVPRSWPRTSPGRRSGRGRRWKSRDGTPRCRWRG